MLYGILKNQRIRNAIPRSVKTAFIETRILLYPVKRRSPLQNIFHCCVHKTGSQWIRKILVDPRVYQYTGHRNQSRDVQVARGADFATIARLSAGKRYRRRRIVSPLYTGFDGFANLSKTEPYRAFFVTRDPRDLIVSWYFSTSFSHPSKKDLQIGRLRARMSEMSKEDGLIFAIEHLAELGIFDAMRSWIGAEAVDASVRVVRFEDLIGPTATAIFREVFEHCDIALPPGTLEHILDDYSFERMSGRRPGQEDPSSKYRKGVPGDWKNHFSARVAARFEELTGDLVDRLGYSAVPIAP